MDEKIIRFAEMVKESKNIVFFGGAGVSTESGVKDYRSEDGLYNTVKQYGVSPEEILSHTFFKKHIDVFYDFYKNYFLVDVKPNKAHFALAELEKMGKLKAVVTQNIDGLHQMAGSKKVLELHGTTSKYYCSKCMRDADSKEVNRDILNDKIPVCKNCGGVIKPRVTLYEEMLDEDTITEAVRCISDADMLIVGGTSLVVQPAASFISYFHGKYIVMINKGETSFDGNADIVFRESIGEVLGKLMENL